MPTALIVEDGPLGTKPLARLVRLRGYEPCSALDAAEALRAVVESRPDVVLLDLMLPDRSGFEVCREIRDHPEAGTTPVVLVTARLASENRPRGFREGATDFVPKPYTPDQIFASLEAAAAWSRAIRSPTGTFEQRIDTGDESAGHLAITTAHGLLQSRLPGRSQVVARAIAELRAWFDSLRDWTKSRGTTASAALVFPDGDDGERLRI